MSGAGPPDEELDRLRRRVLWSMPTGLYLIGSRGDEAGSRRANLMTANLVVQVATEPNIVAAAIDVSSLTRRLIESGGCFSVSILGREDRAVIRRFVKPVETVDYDDSGSLTEMAGEGVFEAVTGAPVVRRAAAWLDCSLHDRVDLGSHLLCLGEVVAVGGPPGEVPAVLRMEDTRMHYGG